MDIQTRRKFLKKMLATTALASSAQYLNALDLLALNSNNGKLPTRALGKTGFNVGIYSLGGQGIIEQLNKTDEAVELINKCIDMGINYIDTAAYYGQDGDKWDDDQLRGISERHFGMVMKSHRNEVFLATKTHSRNYDGAMRHLEKSLENLQTDHIDLWQIHNINYKGNENIDLIFSENGVLKAMEKARDKKIVKYLGITGHFEPNALKRILDRQAFDNVLLPVNAADKHYNSFIENLLPTDVEKQMGVVAMKIPVRGRIFSNGGIISMKEAMFYSLSLPVSTIIVGLNNITELEENIKIAKEYKQLNADEMLAIEEKVKPYKDHLLYYKGLSE